LTFFVIRHKWRFPLLLSVLATGIFMLVDVAFVSANLLKVPEGGWFPVVLAVVMFGIMVTWRRGRELLLSHMKRSSVPLEPFLESLFTAPPRRVPGTAVFLTSTPGTVPHALLHNLAHNKVLHERVVFLTVVIRDEPWVSAANRVCTKKLGHGCYSVMMYFGFKQDPNVVRALEICREQDLSFEPLETSFFLSRETVIPRAQIKGMALWRERLFATMARNAGGAADYFRLPANRIVELGTQVEI
jgi:KUP system potassium uptake protein